MVLKDHKAIGTYGLSLIDSLKKIFGATGRSTAFSLSKREQNGPNCTKRGHF
jgi:hypothetical protein